MIYSLFCSLSLSVCVSLSLSLFLSLYVSLSLSLFLSVCVSLSLSVSLSLCLSLSFYLSGLSLSFSLSLSLCLSFSLSVSVSLSLSLSLSLSTGKGQKDKCSKRYFWWSAIILQIEKENAFVCLSSLFILTIKAMWGYIILVNILYLFWQVDIADFLSQYNTNIQKMKQLKPATNSQAMLFRNCLKVCQVHLH